MTPASQEWIDGLRASVAASRQASLNAAVPNAATEAERTILATHFGAWLESIPELLEGRRTFARGAGPRFDPDAAVVLTTSPAGIAVANTLLAGGGPAASRLRPRIACVTEAEYRRWCMRHPDENHLLHLTHWSWIKTRVPPAREAEFSRHRLGMGECYWLHRTGTTGAGGADGRATHLWTFDGVLPRLRERCVEERRVAPPGA